MTSGETIFESTDSTDATPFSGRDAKAVIRVVMPDNAAWASGLVVKLQWASEFADDTDGTWYDENIEWDEPGPQVVYLFKGSTYRLFADSAGAQGMIAYLTEPTTKHVQDFR